MPRSEARSLTDSKLKALKASDQRQEIRDGLQRGLVFSVTPGGLQQWNLRYRFAGKQRRLILGTYPDMTLAAARDAAADAQHSIRHGHDVVIEQRVKKAKPTDTIAALVDDYMAKHALKKKRTADADDRMLKVDVLPYIGDRSVRTVTRRDVRDLLDRIVKRGSPIAANRTLEVVRKMFNFGIRHDWLEA